MKEGMSKAFLRQFAQENGFTIAHEGKVGITFETDNPQWRVIVRSDHVSAFNSVWPGVTVPGKGVMLTKSAVCWFKFFGNTHFVTDDIGQYPGPFARYREVFEGRSILCRHFSREQMLPVEAIVRGNVFLDGNGMAEYKAKGSICGITLPPGIQNGWAPPAPLFTPTDKSETDDNLDWAGLESILGAAMAAQLRDTCLQIFSRARERLLLYGLLLADTKFEMAADGGKLVIVDEIFTPDTTRAWDAHTFFSSGKIVSTDKQILRDYIAASDWNKVEGAAPPPLTGDLVEATQRAYVKFYLAVKAATEGVSPKQYYATIEEEVDQTLAALR